MIRMKADTGTEGPKTGTGTVTESQAGAGTGVGGLWGVPVWGCCVGACVLVCAGCAGCWGCSGLGAVPCWSKHVPCAASCLTSLCTSTPCIRALCPLASPQQHSPHLDPVTATPGADRLVARVA